MECEFLVIGAGVFGLSIARALRRTGREVRIVDEKGPGAGASGTPLGVLAPHAPDRWNAKKQAQLEALSTLAEIVHELEAETGSDIGYRRCGRLIPLTQEHHRSLWAGRAEAADLCWRGEASLSLVDAVPGWLAGDAAPYGAALCGLSARIDARGYCAALAKSVGGVEAGYRLETLEAGGASFACGRRLSARHVVLATGADAFRLLPESPEGAPAGRGEKGQAALLRLKPGRSVDDLPLIYSDGLYIVPRGRDLVAVGATSERDYADAISVDEQLEVLVERARAVSPALTGATVIERWARLRPRAADKGVLLAPHPSITGVTIATGGFKTGLAMAHRVAAQFVASLD